MNNPFDKVPSTADVSETPDKKTVNSLTALVGKLESILNRKEALLRNEEELAGAIFETFLEDDGTMKDVAHSAEINTMLAKAIQTVENGAERTDKAIRSIPSGIEAHLCEDDRKRLDRNFLSWRELVRLYLPFVLSIGAAAGISIMGGIALSTSANHKKEDYEYRLEILSRWERENAETIAFGHFYKENNPRKYREWQTGRWQKDVAYRDSLIRAHSVDRLK